MKNNEYMSIAINEAVKAAKNDEVPVGAVIVKEGVVISCAHNQKEFERDATKHAEMIAIQRASKKLNNWHLDGCTLYVTLEPCAMCAGAIIQSRIEKVVFGAYDPKGGSLGSCFNLYDIKGFNHYPKVEKGVLEKECSELLKTFFKAKRKM
jgi:Cytosine/adenosine deaminases